MVAEGFDIKHDDAHCDGSLAMAAAAYCIPVLDRDTGGNLIQIRLAVWPFEPSQFKPVPTDRIRELVKAGALVVAEIERLQRLDPDTKELGTP